MCFLKEFVDCYTYKSKHRTYRKDLKCYKLMRRSECSGLVSANMWFPYELGKTYESDAYVSDLDLRNALHGGVFHSYTDLKWARGVFKFIDGSDFVLVSCVIPAGTPYWRNNEFHEFASTKIKIVEIIE